MKLTEARKKVFINVLRETGSTGAAAKAATPWSKASQGGLSTFLDEKRRNPTFAAEWQRAEEDFLGEVEAEIRRRAMEPPIKPVFSRGVKVGEFEDRHSSDRMLLRLASKLDPVWRERSVHHQQVEVRGAVLSISPSDVLLLSEPQQQTLLDLLQVIAHKKGDTPPHEEPGGGPGPMPGPTSHPSQMEGEVGLQQLPQGSTPASGQ
jgi:hypothetical protein